MPSTRLQEIMKEFQGDDAPDQLPFEKHDTRAVSRISRSGRNGYDDDGDEFDDDDDDEDDGPIDMVVTTSAIENDTDLDEMNDNEEHRHDQLPDPDEYKAQIGYARPESRLTRLRRQRFWTMVSGFSLVVFVAILMGVLIGRDSGNTKKSASVDPSSFGRGYDGGIIETGPTAAPTVRKGNDDRIISIVNIVKYLSDPVDLERGGSPQQLAVMWLATSDPRGIQIADTIELKQRYVLAVLYYSMQGSNWNYPYEMGWMGEEDVCNWNTPSVDGVQGLIGADCKGGDTIKVLNFPHSGLGGSIPNEIALLNQLEHIDFSENDLSGRLNAKIGDLKLLKTLNVAQNSFTGKFPDFLGIMSSLTNVDLSKNRIDGEFPTVFSQLSRLETLNIGYNLIYDDVDKFKSLTNMKNLLASNNDIFGTLTDALMEAIPNIQVIDLSANLLGGSLPNKLLTPPKLEVIDIHSNFFNGPIPMQIANPSMLKFISLSNNELTGDISYFPTHWPPTLEHLDLSNNTFSGRLPAFGEMQGLRYLFLAFNDNFDPGPIPKSFTRLANLGDLSLQNTRRTGSIPEGFGTLNNIVLLDLANNALTGTIPADMGDAESLQFLFLNKNYLNGTIPDSFSQLSNMQVLLLERTQLVGDTSVICSAKSSEMKFFATDCSEVNCPLDCCTLCCTDGQGLDADGDGGGDSGTFYPTPTPKDQTIYPTATPQNSGGSGGPGNMAKITEPKPIPAPSPTMSPVASNGISGANAPGDLGFQGGSAVVPPPTQRPTSQTDDLIWGRRELQEETPVDQSQMHMCNGVTWNGQLNPQFENDYKRVTYDFNDETGKFPALATQPTPTSLPMPSPAPAPASAPQTNDLNRALRRTTGRSL